MYSTLLKADDYVTCWHCLRLTK